MMYCAVSGLPRHPLYFRDNAGLEGPELVRPLLRSFPCPNGRLCNLQRAASLWLICKGQDALSFPCLPRQEPLWPWHRHVEYAHSRPVVEERSAGADRADKRIRCSRSQTAKQCYGAENFLLAVHFPWFQTPLQIASVFS